MNCDTIAYYYRFNQFIVVDSSIFGLLAFKCSLKFIWISYCVIVCTFLIFDYPVGLFLCDFMILFYIICLNRHLLHENLWFSLAFTDLVFWFNRLHYSINIGIMLGFYSICYRFTFTVMILINFTIAHTAFSDIIHLLIMFGGFRLFEMEIRIFFKFAKSNH